MRYKNYYIGIWLAGILFAISCGATNPDSLLSGYEELSPFAVSYEKIEPRQAEPYDLVVVEPSHYNKPEVDDIKSTGAKVIAYVSLGEVNPSRWYFPILEERGFLGMNPNWNSYYINLADSVSYNLFFKQVFPELAVRGFDGFFLDTIDAVAPYTTRNHLQPQMVSLINGLRREYPDHMIIQNAGFFLLDQTASSLNAVLIEDVATHYDFQSDSYSLKEENKFFQKIDTIKKLSEGNEIPFLILDFANETNLRSQAVQRLNELPYPYFISTIQLNNISAGLSGNHY